jgi:RHS repeat-associated protein
MATDVYTDSGLCLVTQRCASYVLQPADPVFLKPKGDKGAVPHFNISTTINNAAGTVFDHKTQVAHNESYLAEGQHVPVVIAGQNTGLVDGDTGFLSWAKNLYIETRNAVMDQVDASINSLWSLLPDEVKTTIQNAGAVAGGLSTDDFAAAAKEDAQALLKTLKSTDTLIALAQTAALMGLSAIPVVGQLAAGAAAANRIKNVIEATAGAAEEFGAMMQRWSQPMSPAQMAEERKKLASFIMRVGASALLAALGMSKKLLSKRSKGKENSTETHHAGRGRQGKKSKNECATCKPVIIATGEKTLTQSDFELPGLMPLDWSRKYRSGDQRESWFGQGWSSPWNVTLTLGAGQLHDHDAEGRQVDLPVIDIGTEHFEAYEQFTLTHPEPDTWLILFKEGRSEIFQRVREDHFNLPLARVEDRNHNAIVFRYPAFPEDPFDPWHPEAITDSAGRILHLHWNNIGRLSAITWQPITGEPEQTIARYEYSPTGNLVAHHNAAQAIRRYEWRNHVLVAYVEPDGARYIAEYDRETPTGRVIRSYAETDGRGLSFVYDPRARTNRITDALGRTTHYEYDERDDIIATTGPDGQRVETPFDSNGNLRGKADPLGRKTQYAYDQRGNLTALVDAGGAKTKIKYNDLDLPVSITDAMGHTWLRGYDTTGNLIVATDPLGRATRYAYDQRGLPTTITDPRGREKQLLWDAAGNLTRFTDCSNQHTDYAYDPQGRLIGQRDALGQVSRYEWDAAGQLLALTEPDGGQHAYQWSPEGRLLAYTDPLGALTRWRYDVHGDPIERIDANGHRLRYEYDAVGRLVALTNENGDVTEFAYDIVDRLTDEIGFDGRHQRYGYNAAGELTHLIEAGGSEFGPGKVTHFERDALGRLLNKTTEGDTECVAQFTYDKLGNLTSANNPAAKLAFAYDPAGQLLTETQALAGGDTRTLTHDYDILGNRISTNLPDDRKLNWLFYGPGHLHQIELETNGERQTLCEIERDALHREVKRTQGSLVSRYAYDPMGRLAHHQAARQSRNAEARIERIYRYDRAGNLLGRHDKQRGNTVFQYDPTGRILNAKGRTEEFFEFDPAGNMQPTGLGGFAITGNRLEVYQDLRYEYDVHGNVATRKKGAHEEAEFTWNADHQLKEAKVTRKGTEQTTQYEYDALGRRTRKIDTFGATEYLWDGDLMIESRRNNKNALYLFEPRSFVPLATVQDNKTYWYQCDQVGAPQELTDREGNIVWAADYKVWGEVSLRKTGTDGSARYSRRRQAEPPPVLEQPFRFQGQQFDEETGLHYNRFRYYDPGVGRFVSQDPIGLRGGSNLFAYAPNPMGWVDPFGLANTQNKSNCQCKSKGRGNNRVSDKVQGKPDSEQQALIDMAKEDSKRIPRGKGPVSSQDADAYVELANETNVPVRAKPNDLSGAHGYGPVQPGPNASHIHINGEHVPVPPGYTPPPNANVIR